MKTVYEGKVESFWNWNCVTKEKGKLGIESGKENMKMSCTLLYNTDVIPVYISYFVFVIMFVFILYTVHCE